MPSFSGIMTDTMEVLEPSSVLQAFFLMTPATVWLLNCYFIAY